MSERPPPRGLAAERGRVIDGGERALADRTPARARDEAEGELQLGDGGERLAPECERARGRGETALDELSEACGEAHAELGSQSSPRHVSEDARQSSGERTLSV